MDHKVLVLALYVANLRQIILKIVLNVLVQALMLHSPPMLTFTARRRSGADHFDTAEMDVTKKYLALSTHILRTSTRNFVRRSMQDNTAKASSTRPSQASSADIPRKKLAPAELATIASTDVFPSLRQSPNRKPRVPFVLSTGQNTHNSDGSWILGMVFVMTTWPRNTALGCSDASCCNEAHLGL
jgi:hypothetical protein